MRTFVTGMAFMAVLAAGLLQVMAFAGLDLSDLNVAPPAIVPCRTASVARFEPSSPAIVNEMVRLAEVGKNDVVYDLGSGDGRVVIEAARSGGARCVGVELDAGLVRQSRLNAEKAGVSHRVRILQQDLSATDLGRATVVMLYLSSEANLMLRPRLLRELKPGTRIVSHTHDLGDWKPDRTSVIEDHQVYAWIVPAQVQGSWKLETADKYGNPAVLELNQAYQHVTGRISMGTKSIPLDDLLLKGKAVSFTANAGFGSLLPPIRFTGEVAGGMMQGGFRSENHAGAWSAERGALRDAP